jgi:hypothetical protein
MAKQSPFSYLKFDQTQTVRDKTFIRAHEMKRHHYRNNDFVNQPSNCKSFFFFCYFMDINVEPPSLDAEQCSRQAQQ